MCDRNLDRFKLFFFYDSSICIKLSYGMCILSVSKKIMIQEHDVIDGQISSHVGVVKSMVRAMILDFMSQFTSLIA